MDEVTTKSTEFASAMQQLSAEAEKTLPVEQDLMVRENGPAANQTESGQLEAGLQNLENAIASRFDKLESTYVKKAAEFERQFQKIDEQLAMIRSTESVNKKLFDSLHAELLKYQDNFLRESLQKPFIHDLVHLYDDLTGLSEQLRSAAEEKGKRGRVTQWHENLENGIHSLIEVLHRLEVREIEPKEQFDRACHRVINYESADFPEEDGRIVMRLKRGFVWRDKLIRPEEVIAKRYG
jgi:molecular chaperone GrpE (heat shock protein)